MRYHTIYADPPWMERGGGKSKRGADKHYKLMHTAEIMALNVPSICEPDAHLYLWVTNNFLPDGLKVMEAWGFRYVTMITWFKDREGLGQYFRGITESCLFGVKGHLPYKLDENGKRCQGLTGFTAPKTAHSRKPAEMRRMIERVSYGPYIELFAREPHPGWDVWGDEVESSIDLTTKQGGSNEEKQNRPFHREAGGSRQSGTRVCRQLSDGLALHWQNRRVRKRGHRV